MRHRTAVAHRDVRCLAARDDDVKLKLKLKSKSKSKFSARRGTDALFSVGSGFRYSSTPRSIARAVCAAAGGGGGGEGDGSDGQCEALAGVRSLAVDGFGGCDHALYSAQV
jgi:hypothetical protein